MSIGIATWPGLPWGRLEPFMLLALSEAVFCSACLVLQRHQAPLGSAFELGYNAGRRDAVKEATRRSSTVTPIRRVVSASNREKVGV